VLATLIRMTGDFDVAEDAVQDAVVAALEVWPRTAVPDNPGAWLTTTAKRKALDRIRRESGRRAKEDAAGALLADEQGDQPARGSSVVGDDLLRLIFTCCHPALSVEAQLALTLRTVCRLTTAEIAAVFLVPEPTMGQRISRAKRKIAVARIPYRVPPDHELPDRLGAVLAVVYAVFTAGHHAAAGADLVRVDLAAEAIRLARLLVDLVPDEPEAAGLLALLLATHARRAARLDGTDDVVLLAEQDRSRWDTAAITEAHEIVERTLRRKRVGRYQVEAAIACLHGLAPTWEQTDWPQIAELYELLEWLHPTPVVTVNRAVAVAEVDGPAAGLAVLDRVEGVESWHLYWATRADLLRRLGRLTDAAAAYRSALSCRCNEADRRFLERRLAEVSSPHTTRTGP
jgi:RNA polymerase sigma-70 factor (ECF subfamily)